LYIILRLRKEVHVSTKTVNISFQDSLLSEMDRVARSESRSRSELVREAVRMYIERRDRWNSIFALTKSRTAKLRVAEDDVLKEIQAYRRQRRR
jgi:metal-responsive CopG/Arc/MetJ family transcriptional regulator